MITFEQAQTAREFHEDHEPAGKIYTHRRNGATQTWRTRPGEFRIPVKYGLRGYGAITHHNAGSFHTADQCPTRHVRVQLPDGAGEWFGIMTEPGDETTRTVVQVTTRGASKFRVGSQVEVNTVDITDL